MKKFVNIDVLRVSELAKLQQNEINGGISAIPAIEPPTAGVAPQPIDPPTAGIAPPPPTAGVAPIPDPSRY